MAGQRDPEAGTFGIAHSNTGKTTLLTAVIPELKTRGDRVGEVKHNVHRFDINHAGKDCIQLMQN
ncbi:MAG: molybdopterin-guanine dinucleotide biosynthesis protein B [Geopsychrobacter sp.]|nr:molybdopterin-guanine dinucleotide biosynthesis protein B [Geopsychrobacter sp.]